MKILAPLASAILFLVGTSLAHADATIQLRPIVFNDRNECSRVLEKIQIMADDSASVDAQCSYGSFVADNGFAYSAELSTSLDLHGDISTVSLRPLAFNSAQECAEMLDKVRLMGTDSVSVNANCAYGSFVAINGYAYSAELSVTVTTKACSK